MSRRLLRGKSSSSLDSADGKLKYKDSSAVLHGSSGDALVANPLSQFAATTSAQLAGVLSDETGSGAAVFATSPTLVTPLLGTPTSGTLTNCTGLPASGIASGQLALARGGTNADLSATGGAGKFLKQVSSGAAITVVQPTDLDVTASTNDAGNTSTAITIDWSVAAEQRVTATGNFTLTHSNMVTGVTYVLEVKTGAGSFTGTFASTNWPGGTAPTLTVTASKEDVFTFMKNQAGTIYGFVAGQSMAP